MTEVELCKAVLMYAAFSKHTENLTLSEIKAALSVLFPERTIRAALEEK